MFSVSQALENELQKNPDQAELINQQLVTIKAILSIQCILMTFFVLIFSFKYRVVQGNKRFHQQIQ